MKLSNYIYAMILIGAIVLVIYGMLSTFGETENYNLDMTQNEVYKDLYNNIDEIINTSIDLVIEKFGDIEYITLANPMDITEAKIINDTKYYFEGTVNSLSLTFTNIVNMALGSLTGTPTISYHEFIIPNEYKYARIKVHAENNINEDVT